MKINVLYCLEGARKAKGLTVVIDVFRAFTVEAYLFNNNVKELYPVGSLETAFQLKEDDKDIILIGERGGKIVDGFDYGNSPSDIFNVDFTGKTVVHTTSAGTQGIANAVNAEGIITGSLVCADAIVRYIKQKNPKEVSLVCMGLSGLEQTEEDNFLAEYIKNKLENGKPLDIEKNIEIIKHTSGAKFFDKSLNTIFKEEDFYLSTKLNTFDFVMEITHIKDDIYRARKVMV